VEDCIIRSFITYTLHHVKEENMGGACSTHVEVRYVRKTGK
jgi:hypothetical protein